MCLFVILIYLGIFWNFHRARRPLVSEDLNYLWFAGQQDKNVLHPKDIFNFGKNGQIIDNKVKKFLSSKTKVFYKHSLGHGVGLEIHEAPRLSAKFKSQLQVGNVITIEPGIYIPGWGGVRLEDIVVVKKDSCEIITKVPKEIKEVIV